MHERAGAVKEQSEVEFLKEQLAELRQSYADLAVKAERQAVELAGLKLRIAHLLVDDPGKAESSTLFNVENKLRRTRDLHRRLYDDVRKFGKYLEQMLQAVIPKNEIYQNMIDRYARVIREVDRLEKMPSLVAGRDGSNKLSSAGYRVLTVDDDLQIVVLNAGRDSGVEPGSKWVLLEDSIIQGRLAVVAVRSIVSAAILIEGDLSKIEPGTVVHPAPGKSH